MEHVRRSDGELDDDPRWVDVRHELGNVSLLIDAAVRVSRLDDDGRGLLEDAKRRIDALIVDGCSTGP